MAKKTVTVEIFKRQNKFFNSQACFGSTSIFVIIREMKRVLHFYCIAHALQFPMLHCYIILVTMHWSFDRATEYMWPHGQKQLKVKCLYWNDMSNQRVWPVDLGGAFLYNRFFQLYLKVSSHWVRTLKQSIKQETQFDSEFVENFQENIFQTSFVGKINQM